MKKFECEPCGYIYDPVVGDWVCPICGLGKDVFVPAEGQKQ